MEDGPDMVAEKAQPSGETRRAWLYGIAVFVAALSVRLGYLADMGSSPFYQIAYLKGADQYRFFEWALQIAGGDLVGKGVFNQSPLYAYFLALIFKLCGSGHLLIPRLVQVVIGSGTALLAFALGRRLCGNAAGVVAGLFAAFYGPLILYDGAFLRTGPLAFLNILLVVLMVSGQARPGLLRGLGAGAVLGLGVLGKPNILIMMVVMPWWLLVAARNGGRMAAVRLATGTLAGFLVLMSPLMIRNHEAGAPLLSMTIRGPLEFVSGNHPKGPPSTWQPSQDVQEVVDAADGRLSLAVIEVLKLYRDRPADLLIRQARKSWAFLNGYEAPNNVNYYVEKRYVGFFNKPWITWPILLGPALVGMYSIRRRRKEALALYSYVVLYGIATVAFYVLSRFRVPVVPALCVFAGCGLAGMGTLVGRRRFKPLAVQAAIVAAVVVAVWPRVPDPIQPSDYHNLVRFHMIRKEPDLAAKWARAGLESATVGVERHGDAESYYRLARMMFLSGRDLDEVEAQLITARAKDPPPWLLSLIEPLESEIALRRRIGDFKPGGYRFQNALSVPGGG